MSPFTEQTAKAMLQVNERLRETAGVAKAAGMPTGAIVVASIGPAVATLSTELGRREVAEVLHQLALTVATPKPDNQTGVH